MSFYGSKIVGVVTMGVVLALIVVGCSSGGETAATGGTDTAGTAVAVTSIDQLPRATSPVTSSSSGSLSALSLQALATTGMPFGGDNVATFSSGDSVAACGMYNLTREAIGSAAEGDLILCYVQNVITANLATILAAGEDPYDGNFHVVNLDFGGQQDEEGGPSKIRMKIVKDSSGNITQFVMYACDESDQQMYLNQTISGTDFSMTSKGTFSDTNFSGSYQTDVAGTLNSAGLFTGTKTITNSHSATNIPTSDLNWGAATMSQTSSAFTTSAYSKGAFTDTQQGVTGTYTDRVYSQGQIIDPNTSAATYDLGLLALGDGAVNGAFSGSFTMGQNNFTWGETVNESWSGDTQLAVASNDFTSAAAAGTVPTASESAPTISFSGVEVYDCSDTATVTVTVDQPSLDSSCSNLDLGHDWIDCWSETGQGTESEEPAQASCTTDQQCKDYLQSVVGNQVEQLQLTLDATTCTEASGACLINCNALDGADCAAQMEAGGIGAECDGSFACTFPFVE